MVPLAQGETSWNEEESRKNFELVKRVAIAGDLQSPLLIHPLAEAAGGDFFHNGGKHFGVEERSGVAHIKGVHSRENGGVARAV